MKRKWRPTLSQGVMRQIEKRKRRRWSRTGLVSVLSLMLINIAVVGYHIHQRAKPQTYWPEFTTDKFWKETVVALNDDQVPAFLNINGEQWRVAPVTAFRDGFEHHDGKPFYGIQGQTYCDMRMIVYIESENPIVLRSTIWHEVMHAGGCLHGGDTYWNSINPTGTKHVGVEHLGEFLGNLSAANPGFMYWVAHPNQ